MESSDQASHSFIVKVWRVDSPAEDHDAAWRGHITHVGSGDRRHFKDLEEIPAFLFPYLESMQVRVRMTWRLKKWIKRLQHRPATGNE